MVFLLTIVGLFIAYSQLRIASSKVKLDLYAKRFNIYFNTLSLYQCSFGLIDGDEKQLEAKFLKSVRESRFLFDANDGIFETLEKFRDENQKRKSRAEERDKIKEGSGDRDALKEHEKNAKNSPFEMENCLKSLEVKLYPYLNFKMIDGWDLNIINSVKLWCSRRGMRSR